MNLQIDFLKKDVDRLQKEYGHSSCAAVYGAGRVKNPKTLFLFMNPTAKNYSADPKWKGIRAPWVGTKNIWKMFRALEVLDPETFDRIMNGSLESWTEKFVFDLYAELSKKSVYITNLAKCTQIDARGLHDRIFKEYLENTLEEIYTVNPQRIVSFGNQVSSILLDRPIKVSEYEDKRKEDLIINNRESSVYPTYYPVGQGMRNMDKAIERIRGVLTIN